MIDDLKNILRNALGRPGWFGNYASWAEAKKNSSGYDSQGIVEKVMKSLMQVKSGHAAFERDSVAFKEISYVWPVVAGLQWVAAQRKGTLNVVDFGGSLGSTFFQYQKFFSDLSVKWNIVEQEIFVRYGKEHFEGAHLSFYHTIQECLKSNRPDVVLLSSVLPYLEDPYTVLREIMSVDPPFMIFDKMPFLLGPSVDRITVQRVHPSIYKASYPAWFFDRSKFVAVLYEKYEIVEEFESDERANIPSEFKGFIARHKKNIQA